MGNDFIEPDSSQWLCITAYGSEISVYTLTVHSKNEAPSILSEQGSLRMWHKIDDVVDYIRANYEPSIPIKLLFQSKG